ncbi:MAG: acid phosphatase [Proteobacteria bacterium]|nr:acid phosphatase [Pseudomonadota bacterium]
MRLAAALALLLAPAPALAGPYDAVEHIIVISLENHSFDNLFGDFPGAEGRAQAKAKNVIQRDRAGKAYATLPQVMDTRQEPAVADSRFPADLANAPFPIERYVPAEEKTGDLVHKFYHQQDQIHGGRMDRFAAVSDAGGLVMGYYDGSRLGLWNYAKRYTLLDHFFAGAFGGSMLNHFWLVCACAPRFANAPQELVARFDKAGEMVHGGSVTPDGYAVNTVFSQQQPHPRALDGSDKLMPPQRMPTIADRLEEKGISWAWYAGGWNDADDGNADKSFQFHHQPFVYFAGFGEGEKRREHLKDEEDFLDALQDGNLPAVSFYKPLGKFNLHPEYTDITSGDAHITRILKAIEASPLWPRTVVIVTFDENGGYWDHVAPPAGDRFGPGMRVPTLVISPFSRKGYVDHGVYETSSILAFIEKRHGLKPLNHRDAKAADIGRSLLIAPD